MGKRAKLPPIRKFEPGASGLSYHPYLEAKGYRTQCGNGNSVRLFKVTGGRPKTIGRKALIALLDSFRIADGLQPIMKQDNKNGK